MNKKITLMLITAVVLSLVFPVCASAALLRPCAPGDPACKPAASTCKPGDPSCKPAASACQPGDPACKSPAANSCRPGSRYGCTLLRPSGGSQYPNQSQPSASEAQMLSWVNRERAQEGLPAYVQSPSLTYWARAKSQDMVDKRYFAHQSPTYGSSREMLSNGGLTFAACSENIARYGSLEKAHVGLMASPGHAANILSRGMRNIGIGVVRDSSGNVYVTQLFTR